MTTTLRPFLICAACALLLLPVGCELFETGSPAAMKRAAQEDEDARKTDERLMNPSQVKEDKEKMDQMINAVQGINNTSRTITQPPACTHP